MSAGQVRALSGIPTGNTFDKYASDSALVRRMMAGFERAAADLIDRAAPGSILDVGCGEGVLTNRWAQRLHDAKVVGLDLPDPKLEARWRLWAQPNLRFVAGRAEELPYAAGEFDLVAAIETLEHVADPVWTLAELARVARRHLLISVPREPLWRVLNVARGAYVSGLGNTPGHVSHWSRRGLERLLRPYGELLEVRTPFPWTMALVYVN